MRHAALTRLSALSAPLALGLLLVVPLSAPSVVKWRTTTRVEQQPPVIRNVPARTLIRIVRVAAATPPPTHSAQSTVASAPPTETNAVSVGHVLNGNLAAPFNETDVNLSLAGSYQFTSDPNVSAVVRCGARETPAGAEITSDGRCTLHLTMTGDFGTWTLTPLAHP